MENSGISKEHGWINIFRINEIRVHLLVLGLFKWPQFLWISAWILEITAFYNVDTVSVYTNIILTHISLPMVAHACIYATGIGAFNQS